MPVTAQEATPGGSGVAEAGVETLVEAMIPAESVPPAPSRLFYLGHVTI